MPKELKEAHIEPGPGMKDYICGHCQKHFYDGHELSTKVLCPHCKTPVLVKGKPDSYNGWQSGWEQFFSVVGSLFRKKSSSLLGH